MRTSMNVPDDLLAEAKARAAVEGRTVTSLVVEGLRGVLARPQAIADTAVEPLPRFGAHGQQGWLIDIEDRDALWDALDADGWK